MITRLEDYGDERRSAKAIGSRKKEVADGHGSEIEAARMPGCRETRIVLHNFRLVSRPEELQLLSFSILCGISPTASRQLSIASAALPCFPRRRSHSLKGEFRSARILKGSPPRTAPVISKCLASFSPAFTTRFPLFSSTREMKLFVTSKFCDLRVLENASRRAESSQRRLASAKSFSDAIIASI